MTAASLAGVLVTHVEVLDIIFLDGGVSFRNGVVKGFAFAPMVLKRENTLTEMVLERGLVPFGIRKGLASLVDVLDVGGGVYSMLKLGNVMSCKH